MSDDNFGKPYQSVPPPPRLPREMLEDASGEPPSISVSPSMPVLDSEHPAVSGAPDNVYVGDVLPKRSPVMAPKLDGSLGYASYPSVAPAPVDLFPPATAEGMHASTSVDNADVTVRLNQLDRRLNELKQELEMLKKKTWLQILIEGLRGK